MIEITKLAEDLYCFPIPLPHNPLKWLNCYVIKGRSDRNLLIDTGFYIPACLEVLEQGMRQLDLRPEETDVFLTHLHSDHAGNARILQDRGCRILMGSIDYAYYVRAMETGWMGAGEHAIREGMPRSQMEKMRDNNRDVAVTSGIFTAETVENGDLLHCSGHELECILTPGHTPGHMCLYERDSGTMFLGDHVLFDITPNITFWAGVPDPLGDYLDSLRLLQSYPIRRGLPGHRSLSETPVAQRIDELLDHHQRRFQNLLQVLEQEPGLNAYEIAGRMHWRIHARSWADFPAGQQYFALGETLSHLDHLIHTGQIRREDPDTGSPRYYLI